MVPSKKGIWFRDTSDFLQRFPPQTFADLGQRGPLAIGQAESRLEVRFQNAVLRREILVLKKEFLIHQTGHVRQQARPFVVHRPQRPS
ncbi:MAG TPA: hypothetical protein VIX91_03695 [Candidatus Acidoferrum sp.]